MSFENLSEESSENRTTEILGKKYEVIDLSILNPDLIAQDDRAFVTTQSGNRYMVRRSKSRGGALMIYDERESGFSKGYPLHNQNENIATITQPMKLWVVTDETKQLGKEIESTEVDAIELRKSVDDVLNSTPDELKAKSLAERLKDEVTGKE